MAPASRPAWSLKPKVAYLELNFAALLKKQTTLPSLAYAGIPYQVFGQRSGALARTIAWSRLAIARSDPFIAAIAASRSRSPSALSRLARSSAFSSRARAFIAARSASVNPWDVVPAAVVLLADFCVAFFALIVPSRPGWSGGRHSSVLQQPEDVAIGVGDGGHQAAATDVAHGLLHGGTGGGHLGQLRLDVRHVPVGHRRGHALRSTARHQPDVLALGLEADVVGLVGLRRDAEQGSVHRLGCRQVGHGMQHGLDPLGGRAGHGHLLKSWVTSTRCDVPVR